jgi:GR25 family glycosyltransferase involved in LPS biosynthesis
MQFVSSAPRRAWIINLDHRPDRFENVRRQAEVNGIAIERHSACNPSKGDVVPATDVATQWDTTLNSRFDHTYRPHVILNMSFGERGCAMSHLQLWRKMVGQGLPMAMIFEDDILLAPNFTHRLDQCIAALPPDWDIFYLEYANGYPATKAVNNPPLYKGAYVWHTGAYVMSRKGALTCLQHLPIDGPVDNFLARLTHEGRLVAYLPTPPLAQQVGMDSDIEHTHTQNRTHLKEEATNAAAAAISRSISFPASLPVGASLPHHHTARSYEAATAAHVGPVVIHASYNAHASWPASITNDAILEPAVGGSGYFPGASIIGGMGATFSPSRAYPGSGGFYSIPSPRSAPFTSGSGGFFSISSPRSAPAFPSGSGSVSPWGAEGPYTTFPQSPQPAGAYHHHPHPHGPVYVATTAASPLPVFTASSYAAGGDPSPGPVFPESYVTPFGAMSDYSVMVSPAAAAQSGLVLPASPFEAPPRAFAGTTTHYAGGAPSSPLLGSPLGGHTSLSFPHATGGGAAPFFPGGAGSLERSRSPSSPFGSPFPGFIVGSPADFVRSPLPVPLGYH